MKEKKKVRFQSKTPTEKQKAKRDFDLDYIPYTVLVVKSIQGINMNRPLLALLDSGATHSFIWQDILPQGVKEREGDSVTSSTLAGTFTSNTLITMDTINVLEFLSNQFFHDFKARVFNHKCQYDISLGRDNLHKMGIKLDFELDLVEMHNNIVPMRLFPDRERIGICQCNVYQFT